MTRQLSQISSTAIVASDLEARTLDYAKNARSSATQKAYRSDWAGFGEWCASKGFASLPAAGETVAMFLTDHVGTFKPATMSRKLAAISVAHKAAGLPSPISAEIVRSTFSGIRRAVTVVQTKKAPVRVSHLKAAMLDFPDDLRGKRDRALILIGYAGGFRRSELVAVEVSDLRFVPEGVVITVRKSKTDQEGKGFQKAITYGKIKQTCPVKALKAWLTEAKIAHGPVFRKIDRWGNAGATGLTPQVVATIVKERAPLFGLDADSIGGHSLRAGLVTDAYAQGAGEAHIMKQTGHRSRAILQGYFREGNLFVDNVTARVGL